MGTPVNADNMNHIEDGIEDHEARISILEEGGDSSNFLNKSQITNCLLEVPQRIKLELVDGVLTLKAGSKVIVPNGFEEDGVTPKFDYITVPKDVVFAKTGTKAKQMLTITPSSWSFGWTTATYSGADTDTKSGTMCYRTDLNRVIYQNDVNAVNYALPFAIFSYESGIVTELSQVFNGFGYIGSIVWVDKGVKALAPNGRNEDGSLNNTEWVNDRLVRSDQQAWGTKTGGKLVYSNKFASKVNFQNIERFTSDTYSHQHKYNEQENKWYLSQDAGATWVEEELVILSDDMNITSGQITKIAPKLPFRAVDYNDAVLKTDLSEVHTVVETYSSGSSWYRIWSDGWCEQGGVATINYEKTTVITLLKPYVTNAYHTNVSPYGWTNISDNMNVQEKTESTISIYGTGVSPAGGWGSASCRWEAKGYAQKP